MTDGWRRWAWVVLWWLCCSPLHALDIWPRLRIVVDEAAFTPEQAWHQAQLGTAMSLQHPHQVLAPANSRPHWAAWSMRDSDTEGNLLWLTLQSPTQDHSELWLRQGTGPWVFQPDMNSQARDWGEGYLMPTWLLNTKGVDRLDVLLRTQGPNRVQFPLVVDPPLQYLWRQQRMLLIIGAVLAMPLLVMIYAVCLIRQLNNPRLLLFLGMAACEMVAAMWISGLLNLLWPSLSRSQAAWVGITAYWMLFVWSIFHVQSFLNTPKQYPLAHRLLTCGAWSWLVVVPMCASVWPEWLRALLLVGGSLHAAGMASLALQHWHQSPKAPNALYAGVWLVYLSSAMVYWLYRWFEWPLFTTLGVQFVQGAAVATLLGLSASLQVIDERHQLEQRLLLSTSRSHWYAAAQHDLWQPLQSIQLYAQALLKASAEQQQKLINGLQLASQSVDDFMGHLRFFANGSLEIAIPHPKQVQIDTLLSPVVEEFRPLTHMRHVVLRYRAKDAWVKVDQRSVQRMVRNALTNALNHTPAGGRVLLACQKRGPLLWLLCLDNGLGMSPTQLEHCFEAFTRFDPHASHLNGLGLGLFSVKQLAVQQQMPTRLQSVQGKGTLLGFAMPLTDKPLAA